MEDNIVLINGDCLEVLKDLPAESVDSLITDPPTGGFVLDPFMGSGSTGVVAKLNGFGFIGIEKEKEYFDIAEKRVNNT